MDDFIEEDAQSFTSSTRYQPNAQSSGVGSQTPSQHFAGESTNCTDEEPEADSETSGCVYDIADE
ncbi:hypothetical protein N0V90_001643 [Kalmusia sp. IMI 367209]|nr:hypothetical protein N0V90_001643 [Kalmusia sp. IMI 367209]